MKNELKGIREGPEDETHLEFLMETIYKFVGHRAAMASMASRSKDSLQFTTT